MAAIDFPNNPSIGQVFPAGGARPSWRWDGDKWTRGLIPPTTGGGGGGIPEAPENGILYGRRDGGWSEAVSAIGAVFTGGVAAPSFTAGSEIRTPVINFSAANRFIGFSVDNYVVGDGTGGAEIIATREWTSAHFLTAAQIEVNYLTRQQVEDTFLTKAEATTNFATQTWVNNNFVLMTVLPQLATQNWVLQHFVQRT